MNPEKPDQICSMMAKVGVEPDYTSRVRGDNDSPPF